LISKYLKDEFYLEQTQKARFINVQSRKHKKNRQMKKLLTALIILMVSQPLLAQREAMFTNNMYNMSAFNPAYAGSRDAISILLLHRSQWLNFDGGPITQSFTVHSPIYDNMGLGLSVINDKIGYENNTMVNVDYSYTIRVSTNAKLAFGLKAGLNMYSLDLSEIYGQHPGDPVFYPSNENSVLPNFGFGAYYYTEKYYIGFSIPKLFEINLQDNTYESSSSLTDKSKHYYLSAGTIFDINDMVMLKPTALVKVAMGAPIELDLSAQLIFNEKFLIGLMYRTSADLGFLAGLKITKELDFGYSFDVSTANSTWKYNEGSHEVFLRYDIGNYKNKKSIAAKYF
jgi:type IX secretion system PorP/SprF family membrane protein